MSKPKTNRFVIYRILWLTLCVTIFTYLAYKSTEGFINSNEVIESRNDIADKIKPPAFTFCFAYEHILINRLIDQLNETIGCVDLRRWMQSNQPKNLQSPDSILNATCR